jgi:hypothetical protein
VCLSEGGIFGVTGFLMNMREIFCALDDAALPYHSRSNAAPQRYRLHPHTHLNKTVMGNFEALTATAMEEQSRTDFG